MFIDPQTKSILPSARRAMFIDPKPKHFVLRQEGHVYRPPNQSISPSVRRAMFIGPQTKAFRPPSGGQCL